MNEKGKVPNGVRSPTAQEESILLGSGKLGCNSSPSLIQTI